MITVPGLTDEVLSGAVSWGCVVSSWLGGDYLGDVPVLSGKLTSKVPSSSSDTQVSLTMTVPRFDGRDWRPGSDPTHPLARFGQELDVSILVGSSVTGDTWQVRKGRMLITDWSDDDEGTISVTGESLLRRVAEDKPSAALAPASGATLASEALRILPAGIGLSIDPALVDRACPTSMAWSTDRMAALQDIADAWPALLRIDELGQVSMNAPLPAIPTPILTLHDGSRGTLVRAPRSDSRDGVYNMVVARSSATGSEDIVAVAQQATGPMSTDGDYGIVTREWSSPLITSQSMAQASAVTMLANSIVPASSIPVVHAPDPRIELDDPVAVVRDGQTAWGWVTGIDLPLTVSDIGDGQRTDVGVSS